MPISFLNINGDSVCLSQQRIPKPRTEKGENFSRGLYVAGFSPEVIEDARKEHDAKSKVKVDFGGSALPAFDVDAYIRKAKPKKLKQRYHVTESANMAAEMRPECRTCALSQVRHRPQPEIIIPALLSNGQCINRIEVDHE